MLTGAHVIIYSTDSDADRSFLRDVLRLPHVDVGDGWLIFGLPPGEVAIHPSESSETHELYLMVDDVDAFVAEMQGRGLACDAVANRGWGLLTTLTLPGGGKLGVYQPRHASPKPFEAGGGKKAAPKKKAAKKKAAPKKQAAPKKAAPKKKAAAKKKAGKRR